MNLAQLLVASAARVPHAPALVSGDRVLRSYRELASVVAGRAADLAHRLGVRPGARVAVYASNSPDYLEMLLAIWWAGGTVVPLSALLHPREVQSQVEDCSASLLLVSEDKAVAMNAVEVSCATLALGDVAADRAVWAGGPVPRTYRDPAWIFYTSGTTGKPKGAVLSNANLLAMTMAHLADVESLDEGSGLLHIALMSHAGGLFALPYLARGARQVLTESRTADPAETWGLLRSQAGLSLFAPPVLLRRLTGAADASSADVTRMGTVMVGAAPVLVDDLLTAVEVFGPRVWNGYGQGESPLTITALPTRQLGAAAAEHDLDTLRSVGYPRIATQVRAVDAEDADVPEGEPGEILVAGPTVMAGYLDRPEVNAETLRGGWLHTGDVGVLESGRLTLLDRSKDLVITGGANVYPREVEDALMSHPAVADVAVVGIPDAEWGERVIAVIVCAGGEISSDMLDQHCLGTIARFKRPKEYHFVRELPRNGAGKVLKSELRATFETTGTEERDA